MTTATATEVTAEMTFAQNVDIIDADTGRVWREFVEWRFVERALREANYLIDYEMSTPNLVYVRRVTQTKHDARARHSQ